MAAKTVGLMVQFLTKGVKTGTDEAKKNVLDLWKLLDKIDIKTSQTTMNAKNFGKAFETTIQNSRIVGLVGSIKELTEGMINLSEAQAEYVENYNLLATAYRNNTESADKLIDTLKNLYGLDPSNLTKSLGIYRQMNNALGMNNKTASLLAENTLKLQEDISSLFNIDFTTAGTKLRSALAGQIRPMRDLGVDISQTALQQELYRRGINKSVSDMNRASKTVLIYLTMERQLASANKDASRTINSVSNQMRIFREQIAIAGRQLGAVFIPILRTILPILNGILMALNAVGETILAIFGVDAKKMAGEFGISTGSIGADFDDIGASADGANDKVKKLKGQLRGFDKLNVITTPTKSKGGGGAGGAYGGVDADLLKQLREYDLGEVANQARKVADAILDIFKPLNDLAYDGIKYLWNDVLKPMGEWAKNTLLPVVIDALRSGVKALGEVAKVTGAELKFMIDYFFRPLGKTLGNVVVNIFKNLKTAFDLIAQSKILKFILGTAGLVVGLTKLFQIGNKVLSLFGATRMGKVFNTFNSTLLESIKETKNLRTGWKNFVDLVNSSDKKTIRVLDNVKLGFKGIVDQLVGLSAWQNFVDNLFSSGASVTDWAIGIAGAIANIGGAIETTTALAGVLDTIFKTSFATNPFTAIIGAIIGAGGLIYSLVKAQDEADKTSAKIVELDETALNNIKGYDAQMSHVKDLTDELGNYMDSNGKVKKSDEERVKYILGKLNDALGTEYKMTGNQITLNGDLINSYSDIRDEIDKYIAKLKGKYLLEQYQSKVNELYEKQYEREQKLNGAEDARQQQLKKIRDSFTDPATGLITNQDEFNKSVDTTNKYYDDLEQQIVNTYKNSSAQLQTYEDLSYAISTNNMDDIQKYYDELMSYNHKQAEDYVGEYNNTFEKYMSSTADKTKGYFGNEMTWRNLGNTAGQTYGKALQAGIAPYTNVKLKGDLIISANKVGGTSTVSRGNFSPAKQYASGGFPKKGEVFVAREREPEMVGSINGHTAVANNEQIVSAISIGVAKAMMATNRKSQDINIIASGDTSGMMRFMKFEQKKDDRQYGL